MARFRVSRPARADLARILTTSTERWGIEGRRRYEAILAAAMRKVAADPEGPITRDCTKVSRGIRSFHLRHARADQPGVSVRRPVHVLYYRVVRMGFVEIVRVLHERMEPGLHISADLE
jgi:toxin ParE1/3/4